MTDARLVPDRQELGRRVHLEILDRTQPGDVFYLVADPATVYMRYDGDKWSPDYPFTSMGDEVWHSMERVGDGRPEQLAVVLHNTRGQKAESLAGGP